MSRKVRLCISACLWPMRKMGVAAMAGAHSGFSRGDYAACEFWP
jgi:hypothetical protein